ncbi:MAG: glycosyltransferase [bacterium]|nr:glycosyltransferase [bacterium]
MILSVVTPTRDKRPLLERTLAALRAQQLPADVPWEIVVVDDGSTDDTGAWLARQSAATGPPLHVVSPPANVGRARARNLGAAAARGQWLLFLDDDIVAPPGLLAAHLDLLRRHPGDGAIGFAVTAPELVDGPHLRYLDTRGVAKLPPGPAPARYFVTQNASVPRAAFQAVGGFDEAFHAYGFEDMEVAFRLEDQAQVRFHCLPAPVPVHVHHHTLDQLLAKRRECGHGSLQQLAARHPGRLREMSVHHVLDGVGQAPPAASTRLLRAVLDAGLAASLPALLRRWPLGTGVLPPGFALYTRLMNLAVLAAYRQGVREYDLEAANES